MKSLWAETNVDGWASFKCLRKLKVLRLSLKKWNLEIFGNVVFIFKQLEGELYALDLAAEVRLLNESELSRRREAKGEAWKLSKMVEWLWLQKSIVN